LYLFCRDTLEAGDKYDYFVFGHRHLLIDKTLQGGARYVNLGDWLTYDSYGVWDGSNFEIKHYPER
jgi:UDP-2,3-diacylglucosamine hydrolase